MKAVLGIDAGGTKTLAALVRRDGTVLGLTAGTGVDPTRASDFSAELSGLLGTLVPAGEHQIEAVTLGMPYHGEVARIGAVGDAVVAEMFGPLARACNDVEVAHIGAFGGAHGVLCLAGTGSMAWASGPNGTARAGGFGDLIGDEGSGFDIGRQALARLSREIDGRLPRSAFGVALAGKLGVELSLAGLMDWTYQDDNVRAGVASVARHVSALAGAGDPDAKALLVGAAAELAAVARAAAEATGLGASWIYACAGSVFSDAIVAAEVKRLLGGEPVAGKLPPVGGAALDAARRAGWDTGPAWVAALRDQLNQRGIA